MKREDITALLPDITEEQLDKIMGLHGADVTNLKESLATAQNDLTTARSELTAANEKLKGYDPDWQAKMTDAQKQVGAVPVGSCSLRPTKLGGLQSAVGDQLPI